MKRKGGRRKGREPAPAWVCLRTAPAGSFTWSLGRQGGEDDGQGSTPEDLGARILSLSGRAAPDCEPGDRTVPHPSPT